MPDATAPLPSARTSYDEVPYESHPYPQAHPSRLAVIATLFGLTPPAVETARVLELGCAAGGHLIPMAAALPNATFVGVDLSARQIADGRDQVARFGLTNIELRHASILELDDSYGTFDYVLCHGVFSWVPAPVQEKILAVCARHLSPYGVGYVSYNTYPGWHMRGMIRDMMRFHAAKFAAPAERTRQARALLDFLAESAKPGTELYPALLKKELEAVRHQADHYLFHEHLEEVNEPLYFHQFVDRAGAHGLRYLGEARVATMLSGPLGPDIEKALKLLATDQVQTEQYLDFLRNRTFRETLVVHARNVPSWQLRPEPVGRLHIASGAAPVGTEAPDVRSDAVVQYRGPSGVALSTARPLLKAAMAVLADAWPATVPFAELLSRSREQCGSTEGGENDARGLAAGLVDSYLGSDLIELHGVPVVAQRVAGERPVAFGPARVRAVQNRPIPTVRHELARLPDLERRLLPLLDGTRDRAALTEVLAGEVATGRLQLERDGRPLHDPTEVRATLTAILDQALASLARQALLVG
ncbi:class I SAM-dependent methyltransferase [Gemmata sp. JC673]|uniref:Class I SAM-dependent methyltransferase n=1 Tax=Gemmata algarum TaxID=2975278 RepID=A0ABU5EYZ4_9BACT|nr:class I SAM-dependent methyltransferase [Gemmata algarum]MDY3558854.1 class I SAM-dependent methyltransferase [Gemmata algarum]